MLAREEPNRCLVRGIEWGIMMALLSHGVHDLDIFHSLLLKNKHITVTAVSSRS